MADVILRLRLAGKAFGTRKVLGAIDLELGAREIVAIVGPSGCGKTTLLRIAGGLERDFDGNLEWPADHAPRIGTVFQEPRLLPWRSVRENLRLAQETPDPALADKLLDTLGLLPFADSYPGTLSLGMARRVAIARAFAVSPDLVLLDEPFVSLDADMAAQSRDLVLAAWRAKPIAMLLVTHDRAEAKSIADRILELGGEPSRIVAEIGVTAPRRS
ncbi:MAG: ABC transporter ATP-binding protein [Alphaproteobacteria bacterium]|nr:ABC transporter ATP-binding protein [Alphaproteobacteria bacterium]